MNSQNFLAQLPINSTLETCKTLLVDHYGQRLKGLILFGSAARQERTDTSDIDLLVLLPSTIDHAQELSSLVDLLYPLQLEATHWISIKPAAQDDFEAGNTQLYRNIQQEGIRLL
ncbi:nucleotidyltransferase family protein [Leptothoe sp. PORK10 BA2]|uniref:nucleotidyltransferase family protein n=1 Tax=Leptothoe sp. PORK10 BA2 TaxID=3110254 RepID=UPI002B21B1CB|nr:nucleotidyltransferase domain-containing protein [Leptothoe sp. PORK10 BA2]MEA5465601.1 nucleotidyltransferase domain-containing protein [Leptothoe sp. PORK10 BA2]